MDSFRGSGEVEAYWETLFADAAVFIGGFGYADGVGKGDVLMDGEVDVGEVVQGPHGGTAQDGYLVTTAAARGEKPFSLILAEGVSEDHPGLGNGEKALVTPRGPF